MTDRTVLVRLRANASDFNRAMVGAGASVKALNNEIDKTNDRTAWLAQGILALGPTLSPLGAAVVPVISGLTTQLTMAGAAAVTTVLAFQGVGDALESVSDYQLEPTAANFEKMRLALEKIGPEGAEFVQFLNEVGPAFAELQMAARAGMFPGMEDGIENMMVLLPQLEQIVSNVAGALGDLTSQAGSNLAGPRFAEFFDYMENEARPILMQMGRTFGNFIDGFGAMMVAFGPLTADFSGGFESMSKRFADWAHALDSSDSFERFVEYVREAVPIAKDFLSSLSDAFVGLLQAAAPVGEVILSKVLTPMLDLITAIASTPAGTAFLALAAGISAIGRAQAIASITTGGLVGKIAKSSTAAIFATKTYAGLGGALAVYSRNALTAGAASQRMAAQNARATAAVGRLKPAFAQGAANIALMGAAFTDLDDKAGYANTTMLTAAGFLIGGPVGAGIGALAGVTLDLGDAFDKAEDYALDLNAALDAGTFSAAKARAELTAYQDDIKTNSVGEFFKNMFDPDVIVNFTQAAWGAKTEVEQMAEAVERAAAAAENSFDPFADLAGGLTGAFAGVGDEVVKFADTGAGRLDAVAAAVANLDSELMSTEQSASALAQALEAIIDPNLNLSEATDKWVQALRQLNDDLGENDRLLKGNSDAALANREVIRDRVKALMGVLSAEAEAGASSERLSRRLQQQRKALLDAGEAAGISRKDMRQYLDVLGLTPELVKTIVEANTKDANGKVKETQKLLDDLTDKEYKAFIDGVNDGVRAAVDGARALLNSIDGDSATTYIKTIRIVENRGSTQGGIPKFAASGGYIRGPGTPTSDSIPAWLSDKEYVVKAAAVQKYGVGFFDQANAMRLAEGGLVSHTHASRYAGGGPVQRFNPNPKNIDQFRESLREFERAMRSMGRWSAAMEKMSDRMLATGKDFDKLRESIKQQKQEIRSAAMNSFNNDPFGNGLAGFDLQVKADRNDARSMKAALKALRKKGLNGPLFEALAMSGDLNTAQQMGSLGFKGIRQREKWFGQANFQRQQLANFAVTQGTREERRELRQLRRTIDRLEDRLRHVRGDVRSGAREGVGDRNRRTRQRVRAGK